MGQGNTGSYALGNIKGTLSAIAIESKVKEICNVINQHLIPLLGKMNGWDLTKLPFLDIDFLNTNFSSMIPFSFCTVFRRFFSDLNLPIIIF